MSIGDVGVFMFWMGRGCLRRRFVGFCVLGRCGWLLIAVLLGRVRFLFVAWLGPFCLRVIGIWFARVVGWSGFLLLWFR